MDALPRVLVDPPWLRTAKEEEPEEDESVVVSGLEPPAEQSIVWAPGEREKWSAISSRGSWKEHEWAEAVQSQRDGRRSYAPTTVADLLAQASEQLVRPMLADWRPDVSWDFAHSIKPIVARFELDARDLAVHAAKRNAYGTGEVLLPYLDLEVARLMADWLYRLKSARAVTRAWFGRHGVAAVPFLVPDAVGKRRVVRRNAKAALRQIASEYSADAVVEAARAHGDAAADAVAQLLAAEAPKTLPSDPRSGWEPEPPRVPRWADPGSLPRPVLRDGGGALPSAATRNLLAMLAMARIPHQFDGLEKGLDEALGICEPAALAAFGWALFEAWRGAGMSGRESWALTALGRLGDDDTVRRLAPLVRVWPGQSGHARAVQGLEVLAAIGTDVALIHLHGIAQKVKYQGLRERAQRKLEEVATRLGLTAEQLADRLVPDFGLDADGGMVLDYGPRRFVVGFDEQLKPYVMDEDGKRRKALPKPGVKDDDLLAPAAYRRFAGLKKDVRTVAADQIHRLESAMVTGRRWTSVEFRAFFVGHPLLRHIARRLVWLSEPEEGGVTAFRIAEDGSLADVEDDTFTLPDSARVGIAHPLQLGEALNAWSELFADYEILQPFPQLGRTAHALTDEERKSGRLERFEDLTVPFGKVLGLVRRGWERGAPQDNGTEFWISRAVPGGGHVVINLDPGIQVGYVDMTPEQKLEQVWFGSRPDYGWAGRDTERCFGDLDPVTASEVLADLTELADAAI
jgi:hypothetical protein